MASKFVHSSSTNFICFIINKMPHPTVRAAWGTVVSFESERRSARRRGISDDMKNLRAQINENGEELSTERTLSLVSRLIEKIEQQLDMTDARGSIADYIKLLQLQKELEERRFRRIEVKWVDTD